MKTLAVLALALLLLAEGVAGGGDPGGVIVKVNVQTDGPGGEPAISGIVPLKEGDAYSLKRVDEAVKKIFQTGLFANVTVLKAGTDRVELVFILTRKLLVKNISFLGEGDLPRKALRQGLESLRPGSEFLPEKLQKARAEATSLLQAEGFYQPALDIVPEMNPKEPSVDLAFRISSWKRFPVRSLKFEGELGLQETDLRRRMKTREGEVYVPSELRRDLGRLEAYYRSLGYSRARIGLTGESVDEAAGRVDVAVDIQSGERITVVVSGVDIPLELLTPIWEERIFEEWGIAEGEVRILNFLRDKGYLFAQIRSEIQRDGNELRILHTVTPGERYKVDAVEFKGNQSFPALRLKRELGIGEKIPFFPLIEGQRLFEIPRLLELFYQASGFPRPRIDLDLERKGTSVTAIYTIEEGSQQKVERIALEGIHLLPRERILAEIVSREGGPFFQPNLQRDIERINTFYLNQGVRGTRVSAEVTPAGDSRFVVTFRVNEGEMTKIANIILTGNRTTKRSTIFKEIQVREGQDALYEKIQETRRRLERLGIFSEVKVDEIPVSPGEESLLISLQEGERNYTSLGVGLETKNEPRSLALWENAIQPRGTAEFIRTNLFGIAAQFSLVTQFSLIEKRAVAAWEQPYFFGIPLQTTLNAWLEREDRTSFGFDRRGISLNAIRAISGNTLVLGTLSWSRTKLTFLKIAESGVDRQLLPYSTTLLSTSLIWDRRDDTFNPELGSFFSVVGEWAYPLFKTESDYLKAFLKFQHFHPILPRVNVNLTARMGLGRGKMPIPERFFAGGSNSFRGEEFDRLGPKDPDSGMPVGGKAMFLVNLEMTFPVVGSLRYLSGAVFYDLGNVFAQRADFSPFAFRGALGFGLRYRTPLGPVRLELAWNLDEPERRGKPLAFITIGNVF